MNESKGKFILTALSAPKKEHDPSLKPIPFFMECREDEEETRCTCGEQYVEAHTCPFGVEVDMDESECLCCEFCTKKCEDSI